MLAVLSMFIGEGTGTGWTIKDGSPQLLLDAKTNDSNSEFKKWLVGFTDGDGCFSIYKMKNTYGLKYSISQSVYNLRILYYIKENVGYGNVSKELKSYNKNNSKCASYSIYSRKVLNTVIFPIFDKYPLLTSKYYNYIRFKKAWLILEDSNLTREEKNERIEILLAEKMPNNFISPVLSNLNENSKYEDINNVISLSWLIGFFEAEGCFFIGKKNKNSYRIEFSLTQKLDYLLLYLIKRLLHIPNKICYNKDCHKLATSNSRVINSIILLFNNKLKGMKSLEFKLWARAKYYNDTQNYRKIEKLFLILKKFGN
jgi:hypothetical protein